MPRSDATPRARRSGRHGVRGCSHRTFAQGVHDIAHLRGKGTFDEHAVAVEDERVEHLCATATVFEPRIRPIVPSEVIDADHDIGAASSVLADLVVITWGVVAKARHL